MEAKQYAARNRQGSDWFSHDTASSTHASLPAAAPAASPKPAAPPQSPVSNNSVSNNNVVNSPTPQHVEASPLSPPAVEHTSPPAEGSNMPARTQPIKPSSDSNQWYKYEGQTSNDKATEGHHHQQQQRGTAADWFSHDHGAAGEAAGGGVHVRGSSKELGANAARMRGESEQWFSHDATAASSATHSARARGRPAGTSSDMHNVFHHSTAGN